MRSVQREVYSVKCKGAADADAANGIMPVLLLTVSLGGVEPQLRSLLHQSARAGLNRMQGAHPNLRIEALFGEDEDRTYECTLFAEEAGECQHSQHTEK